MPRPLSIYWGTSYSIAFFKLGSILWTLGKIKNRKICVQKRELWRTEWNKWTCFLIFSSPDPHYLLNSRNRLPTELSSLTSCSRHLRKDISAQDSISRRHSYLNLFAICSNTMSVLPVSFLVTFPPVLLFVGSLSFFLDLVFLLHS